MPVPKLAEKAHHKLALINQQKKQAATHDTQDVQYTLSYGQSIGNCYTASLYLGLLSLLETHPQNLSEHRIGFYSYGSGCTAEFFSGIVQPTYQHVLYKNDHQTQLTTRTPIDIKQYEYFYTYPHIKNHSHCRILTPGLFISANTAITNIILPNTNMRKSLNMRVQVPGKLILSGEHAVVHGAPAIVGCINRHLIIDITETQTPGISIDNQQHQQHKNDLFLLAHHAHCQQKYRAYQNKRGQLMDILPEPLDLAWYTIADFYHKHPSHSPPAMHINITSHIKIGSGLGSSAALIVALYRALSTWHQITLSPTELRHLATQTEHLVHGTSSGLDITAVSEQCSGIYENKHWQPISLPNLDWVLIDTGTPQSQTGECVTHSRTHFDKQPKLVDHFAHCTHELIHALKKQNTDDIKKQLEQNQQLLNALDVVPTRVQNFIDTLSKQGGCAKLTGAGSIKGDSGGMLLALAHPALPQLCDSFSYQAKPIQFLSHTLAGA